ncbi:MAG: plasmid stabilization protein [Rhodospirillales bacterium]|nr:plasmid stabilization protein [Rhodospirillales bacterium]
MATLTIRKLDPEVKNRLRVRAAQQGHSMEEEARRILTHACETERTAESLVDVARRLFGPDHGVDLELPLREPGREPPRFD